MKLIGLTILLLLMSALSLVAPSLWQGFVILMIVILLALDDNNQPPAE